MNNINKIYYINLDTRPDRYEHFLKQCSEHNIPYNKINRYRAIDGNTYNFSKSEYDMFKNVDYLGQEYMKRIMGNQLSHYNILKEMIKNDYKYIIILQDDVIFRRNIVNHLTKLINNVPVDAEIINIGFHQFASFNNFIPWDLNKTDNSMIKEKINDEICILEETVNPCSLGYIVTNKGAKNLTKFFEENGFYRATDWNYNDYLRNKNIFYGSNVVLCTGNPNLGSDIFIN
jgi:GR25 family glycosyltransferase involved in LPS biosynthesis